MRVSTSTLMGRLDMALSNFIKGYRNGALITDKLFPRLEVTRQSDVFWIFGKENMQLTEQTLRAAGTPAQETRFSLSTDRYFAPSHALKSIVSDEERLAYTVGDLDMDAAQMNQDKILLDREYRAMMLATNAANYPAANTLALSGAAQLDQSATSDPLKIASQARTVIAQSGAVQPNVLILGFDVAEVLRRHPALLQRFQYVTITGSLSDAQLATVFNVAEVVVASAITNNPVSGVNSFVWSNIMLFVYVSPTIGAAGVLGVGAEGKVGPKQLSFGKSFTWIGAPETVGGYGVTIGRHPDISAKADVVAVDWYSDEKITGPDVAYLVTNCLAANN